MQGDPFRLAQIEASHPEIAKAIEKGDVNELARLMHRNNEERVKELK